MLFQIVTFDAVSIADGNQLLTKWGHKMGPMNRPVGIQQAHALLHNGKPVAVCMTADLVRETVGEANFLNRKNCVELARLCAEDGDWNCVLLRLWRLAIFPCFGREYAVSYHDAKLHTEDLYRFDGWEKVGYSRSGTDTRSVRKGRENMFGFGRDYRHRQMIASDAPAARAIT